MLDLWRELVKKGRHMAMKPPTVKEKGVEESVKRLNPDR